MSLRRKLVDLLLIIFISSLSQGQGAEEGWTWGQALDPAIPQSAVGMKSYRKNRLKKLPLSTVPGDDEGSICQSFKFLDLDVPPDAPEDVTIMRSHREVRFDLVRKSILAAILNWPPNSEKATNFDEEDAPDIRPINITDPAYKGHGVLFSVFRSTNVDASGNAPGILSTGTAYIVSPYCIATAAHNVVLEKFIREHPKYAHLSLSPYAEAVEFWPLMNGLTPDMYDGRGMLIDAGKRAKSVKFHPSWDPQGFGYAEHDVAVLQLCEDVGLQYGCCAPRRTVPATIYTKQICVSGYQVEEGCSLSFIITECKGHVRESHIHTTTTNKIFYTAEPAARKGQSGSPVRLVDADGTHFIIGTHTTAEKETSTRIKYGGIVFDGYFDRLGMWVTGFEGEARGSVLPSRLIAPAAAAAAAAADGGGGSGSSGQDLAPRTARGGARTAGPAARGAAADEAAAPVSERDALLATIIDASTSTQNRRRALQALSGIARDGISSYRLEAVGHLVQIARDTDSSHETQSSAVRALAHCVGDREQHIRERVLDESSNIALDQDVRPASRAEAAMILVDTVSRQRPTDDRAAYFRRRLGEVLSEFRQTIGARGSDVSTIGSFQAVVSAAGPLGL
jgi:hypothetical protein